MAGPALMLGMADHVVMTVDAFAYLNGPHTVEEFTGAATTGPDLGGPDVHARRSGLASIVVADEEEAAWAVSDLLSYLPSNWLDQAPTVPLRRPRSTGPAGWRPPPSRTGRPPPTTCAR